MSTNNSIPNNTTPAAQAEKPQRGTSYKIPQEDWSWIPILVAIAVLLPTSIWIWPEVFYEWKLENDTLIKIAIGIAVIALAIKLNTWIKNKSEAVVEIKPMGGSNGGVLSSPTQNTIIPDMKTSQSKPLTKSHNMSYGAGKGAAKEAGHYRHEDILKDDKTDMGMTLKGWGGSEGGSGSADAAGRSVKKPVRR